METKHIMRDAYISEEEMKQSAIEESQSCDKPNLHMLYLPLLQ